MQEIKIDVRVPQSLGGTGWPYRTEMMYDTGSTNLTIFFDELQVLDINPNILSHQSIQTAGGSIQALEMALELRIINQSLQRVLKDWHIELALVMVRSGPNALRLSSKSLNGQFLIAEHPTDLRLCVATSKTALSRLL